MNTDRDLECTCDAGVFAKCPVCLRAARVGDERRLADDGRRQKEATAMREKARRARALFSPMSILDQMNGWKK